MGKKKKRNESVTGVFSRNKNGFGFVTVDGASEDDLDVYISAYDTKGAMTGDRVAIDIIPEWLWERNRPEGMVTRILEHSVTEIAGTFRFRKKGGIVLPADGKRGMPVVIPQGETSGAKTGDKVVAVITRYPEGGAAAQGHISSIIARKGDPGADIKELIRSKGILDSFPSSAKAQASYIDRENRESVLKDGELECRRDLRDRKIFTIDGAHSKDFDDAVSIERVDDGYILGVHIADVTQYVTEDSPLDKEALKRGNSVYVVDQVVPMLPVELSNGICSLNEGVDRLCLSVDMKVSASGEVTGHEIYESVIRSCHRLIYDDVSDILEKKDRKLIEKYEDIYEDLNAMHELYMILAKARSERGSIDFEVDEADILLDKNGTAVDVRVAERRTANRLIEEFMLLANETVAQSFFWLDIPFIYRVHEKPETKKMNELKSFLAGLSIPMKADASNVHPKVLSGILALAEGEEYEGVVASVMLKCMQKAYYSTDCGGHYGLSLKYYCHFTSPIRRYADLFIHRAIKRWLHGDMEGTASKAVEAADNASKMERLAVETEREGEKMKKAEYMTQHIGEVYDGIISGVINSGFFVQLPNTVEGMVRLDSLTDDYYEAITEKHMILGLRTRKSYALGDKVKVVCVDADPYLRTVDFELAVKKKKRRRR